MGGPEGWGEKEGGRAFCTQVPAGVGATSTWTGPLATPRQLGGQQASAAAPWGQATLTESPGALSLRRGFCTQGIPRYRGQRTPWVWHQVGWGWGPLMPSVGLLPEVGIAFLICEGQGAAGRVGAGLKGRPHPQASGPQPFGRFAPGLCKWKATWTTWRVPEALKSSLKESLVWDYIFPTHFWC